jgi:hypothetical protein
MDCAGRTPAATALSDGQRLIKFPQAFVRSKSGVALRLPPQSKTLSVA